MAIRLQKLCDPCMERDIEHTATTVTVRIAGLEREVDLCEDHEKEFVAPLRQLLFEQGRKPVASQGLPATGDKKRGGQCFMPGCSETRELQNLSTHMRSVHGITLSEARRVHGVEIERAERGAGEQCPYPGCTAHPSTDVAVGSHFKTMHGMTFDQWRIESGQVTEGILDCDVTGCKGGPNNTVFKSLRPQGIAAHKKQIHGVVGTTPAAAALRKKTAAKKATTSR